MSEHSNQLSPAELERVAWLGEELCKAGQAIGKILRHGYRGSREGEDDNRTALACELGDVMAALTFMFAARDVDPELVKAARDSKIARIWKWLHHQPRPARPVDPCAPRTIFDVVEVYQGVAARAEAERRAWQYLDDLRRGTAATPGT